MLVNARAAANEARQLELVQLMGRIKEGLGANGRGAAGFDEVLGGLRTRADPDHGGGPQLPAAGMDVPGLRLGRVSPGWNGARCAAGRRCR